MGIILGIAFVWFIIEMLVWVLIAQFISGWYVFFWFIMAFIIGFNLIKKTVSALNPMAQQVKSGVIPSAANTPSESVITKSVAFGIAGLLFLIPGVLSDVLAMILLIPAIQKLLTTKAKAYAMSNQDKMMAMMAKQMGGQNPFGAMVGNPFGGTTVDGTAKPINKNLKKLNQANDD